MAVQMLKQPQSRIAAELAKGTTKFNLQSSAFIIRQASLVK